MNLKNEILVTGTSGFRGGSGAKAAPLRDPSGSPSSSAPDFARDFSPEPAFAPGTFLTINVAG